MEKKEQPQHVKLLNFETCFVVIAILLITSAFCHRMQIDDPAAYRKSYWIGVELITLIISALASLAHFLLTIYFLFKKEFKIAMITFLVFVSLLLAVILALWIDAATLVYMT